MRILGIDPGVATIGIGLLDAKSPQDLGAPEWLTIETKPGVPLGDRLAEIAEDFTELLKEFSPEYAVMERVFFSVNEKSAIEVAHARGVLLQLLVTHGVTVLEPNPMQLKHAITGDGNADKRQIQEMLMRMFTLESPPRPDDAADALALAVYGALQSRITG